MNENDINAFLEDNEFSDFDHDFLDTDFIIPDQENNNLSNNQDDEMEVILCISILTLKMKNSTMLLIPIEI